MTLSVRGDARHGPSARAWPSLAGVAAVTLLAVLTPAVQCLEIRGSGFPNVLLPLDETTQISLRFMHSVEKTPVVEEFSVQGQGLVLVATSFQSLGAGLGGLDDKELLLDGNCFQVRDLSRPVGRLVLRVSELTAHSLVCGQQTIDLFPLVPDGGRVEIGVRRLPRLVYWVLARRYPPP